MLRPWLAPGQPSPSAPVREPLVHFVMLGTALFVLHTVLAGGRRAIAGARARS
jgi:hypothetical protein